MVKKIEEYASDIEEILSEEFIPQINNNSIFLVWWSDNGWTGKCNAPDTNKSCKNYDFGRNCSKRKRGCSSAYIFKCYGMYIDDEKLYDAIEPEKYVFFISKNPYDKKYYIIGYYYISEKGEGVPPDCQKSIPSAQWDYYIKGDRNKSKMIYNYSKSDNNVLFDKEFIEKNTQLELEWNKVTLENYSDDGKIGLWFRNNDKAIQDEDAIGILEIIKNKTTMSRKINTNKESGQNMEKKRGVYEILYNELANNKFHSFEELNLRWNNLKFLENSQRKEATIPTRWLFEYILRKCRNPYSARFLETEKAIINLLNINPSLKKQIKDTALNLIGNMVFKRGYTHFKIPDRYGLELTLDMFNEALGENYKPDDIFQAIINKKSTKDYIEKKDFGRIHNLIKTFPEKIEDIHVIIPEKIMDQLEANYQQVISNDITSDSNEDFNIDSQISEEDKKALRLPQKRNENVNRYLRNPKLTELKKRKMQYTCQVCGKKIPKTDGSFYIETHHIIPLYDGGLDVSSNLVVVCPNHHVMMQYSLPEENISITSHEIRFSIDGYDVRLKK